MSAQPNGVDVNLGAASLAKLTTISPPTSSGPVIAIDLDDVLSETNAAISECEHTRKPPTI
jgi:hypothetical protein